MVPAARTLRQLLASPVDFFEEHPPAETLPLAAGVVVLFSLALVGSILAVGMLAAGAVDATVTMDNPDRPPEQICSGYEDEADSVIAEDCDEPETVERDVGTLIQEEMSDFLWIGFVGPFVLWALSTVVLYVGATIMDGTPSFEGTLAVAGWAALPELGRAAVGVAGLAIAFRNVTVTDPDRVVDAMEAAMAPVEPLLVVASLLTLAWQWYLLSAGLSTDADIDMAAAAVAVGVPLGLFGLFGLL